jgi:hypothetical protein
LQLNKGDDSTKKDSYIDANQGFTMCGNHPNILPLFGRLGRPLRHEAHPHLAKRRPKAKGVGDGLPPTTALGSIYS